MMNGKCPRFRIWNRHTDELVEVSASDMQMAIKKSGWKSTEIVVIPMGRKIWLNEIKKYVSPSRED